MSHRPLKRLGQHFLQQPQIAQKIVDALEISTADDVVEIGPGPGVLPPLILQKEPRRFQVVEIDPRWAAELEKQYGDRFILHHADFLKWPEEKHLQAEHPALLIGNIPYNITSPILFKMVENRAFYKRAVIMMQKEVARRIVAQSGNKEYGILSVLLQALCEVRYLFDVGRGNFFPVPNVDSAVVLFNLQKAPAGIEDVELFRRVVRGAFNQRRKMLRNSLARIFAPNVVDCIDSIALDRRPESLSVEEFKTLSNSITKLMNNG